MGGRAKPLVTVGVQLSSGSGGLNLPLPGMGRVSFWSKERTRGRELGDQRTPEAAVWGVRTNPIPGR